MQLFKKKAYTLYYEDEIIPPPEGCSTYSVAPGYDNDPNDGYLGYNIVDYLDCEGNPQTISVASNESTQYICATEIIGDNMGGGAVLETEGICTIVPWDSLTANRENGFVSLSGTLDSSVACGYPEPLDAIYIAVHTTSMLSVGDRVFEQGTGTTFFNGSNGIPPFTPMYWRLSLQTEVNPCGSSYRVLIDKDGFVSDLYCCP